MRLRELQKKPFPNRENAKKELIKILQNAHAGEKAAANAYYGHALSLFVRDKTEKKEILDIYTDELAHRAHLFQMLSSLSSKPKKIKELIMYLVGFTIGFLCLFGGWFIPMYGAGKLESTNIEEYEVAARLALLSGNIEMVEDLLVFAEVEWDHELYFRNKASSHWMSKYIRMWVPTKKRALIRDDFKAFQNFIV